MSDFRETLYTIDKQGHRKWVYPALVSGFFHRRRSIVAAILVAIYLLMPWITIRGEQAVLLNIAGRKFTFFGTTFWATDTTVMALTLLGLGLCLFFFTAVFGRVWCGWACPETVFLEFIFRPIETMIEGSPAQRKRLDDGPWNGEKVLKKIVKYTCFTIICWTLANTALAYFFGRDAVIQMIKHSPFENLSPFLVQFFVTGALLFQFAWFREQFCTVVCPYARFQSVLLDQRSLLVGYDVRRGEPRQKGKAKDGEAAGDCVDCGLCVRVCPTGIDIRNGVQLECIHCAACVDACDSIMTKVGRPVGLIRYDNQDRFEGRPGRFLRPRVIVYAVLITVVATALTATLLTRSESDSQIIRGAYDAPFSTLPDGRISNHLRVHLSNKSNKLEQYSIKMVEPAGIELVVPADPFPLAADSETTVPLFFNFDQKLLTKGRIQIIVQITGKSGYSKQEKAVLFGPGE